MENQDELKMILITYALEGGERGGGGGRKGRGGGEAAEKRKKGRERERLGERRFLS